LKRKHIIYAVIIYIVSRILYYTIGLSVLKLDLLNKNVAVAEVVTLLGLCYFSQNLWKNSTKEMIENAKILKKSSLIFDEGILLFVTVFAQVDNFRKLYYQTGLYETNPPLFLMIGILSVTSMIIFVYFLVNSFFVTLAKYKNNK